jgi:hypothetical protein
MNSEPQGVVKGLYIFPKGGFTPGDNFQPVIFAKLAYPPEKVSLQEVLYVGDLPFSALSTEYFPYDLHLALSLNGQEKENLSSCNYCKTGGFECKPGISTGVLAFLKKGQAGSRLSGKMGQNRSFRIFFTWVGFVKSACRKAVLKIFGEASIPRGRGCNEQNCHSGFSPIPHATTGQDSGKAPCRVSMEGSLS